VPLLTPTVCGTGRAPVDLRPYGAQDRAAVTRLLSILPALYPNGVEWLQRRLGELRPDGPRCTLAVTNTVPIGVAIETPKSTMNLKLSTLYVAHSYRRQGVGRELVRALVGHWLMEGRGHVYVTAAHTAADSVQSCLGEFGFRRVAEIENRYGAGRHEVVLAWNPQES
jgi:ribosomal protein S18 acetylase RimI-like enzyme